MGGYGSGRHSYRGKVESMRALDVNKLHRAGALRQGSLGGWQWSVDGEREADIRYRMETGGLRLIYRCRSYGADWERMDYIAPIVRRPCRFGGSRPYFKCPGVVNGRYCGRIVVKLYGGRLFLCRHCHDLAYNSQSERPDQRLLRKANKKRMALGGEPGTAAILPKRPKGMWRRTYEREIAAILMAEDQADAQFTFWFARRFGTDAMQDLLQ